MQGVIGCCRQGFKLAVAAAAAGEANRLEGKAQDLQDLISSAHVGHGFRGCKGLCCRWDLRSKLVAAAAAREA
jgi:hypothetical protein